MFEKNDIQSAIGRDIALGDDMKSAIRLWGDIYAMTPPWLDKNTSTMGIGRAIAAEAARLATIESEIVIDGGRRAEALTEAMTPLIKRLRGDIEKGVAMGTVLWKPYYAGGRIFIDTIGADRIFPISFNSDGEITSCAFADRVRAGRKWYTRIEVHETGGEYKITNKAYVSDSESALGIKTELGAVEQWKNILPFVTIRNLKKPLWGVFKMPGVNTVEPSSPMGMSLFAAATDMLREADNIYSGLLWEYESGKRALYVDEQAFKQGKDGKPILPDKRLYRTIDSGTADFYKEFSPDFRAEGYLTGLDAVLKKIEFVCGLAYGTISDPQVTDKTAEEVRASKQRLYATVTDIQKAAENALREVIDACSALCDLYELSDDDGYEARFTWDDSIITDRAKEFTERSQMVSMGAMSLSEFRAWYLGESEEASSREIEKMNAGMELTEE